MARSRLENRYRAHTTTWPEFMSLLRRGDRTGVAEFLSDQLFLLGIYLSCIAIALLSVLGSSAMLMAMWGYYTGNDALVISSVGWMTYSVPFVMIFALVSQIVIHTDRLRRRSRSVCMTIWDTSAKIMTNGTE